MTVEAFVEYINTHDDPALTAEMSLLIPRKLPNRQKLLQTPRKLPLIRQKLPQSPQKHLLLKTPTAATLQRSRSSLSLSQLQAYFSFP